MIAFTCRVFASIFSIESLIARKPAANSPLDAAALHAPEVTVWTSPARAALAGELLDVMGSAVRPLGIGGPRSAEVDSLGKRLDCPAGDDLRKLLIERPAAFLLLTTWQGVSSQALRNAIGAGTRVLSLEPWAAELEDLDAPAAATLAASVVFMPAFVASPGYQRAADPRDHLDAPRLIRFTSFGRPEQGSLFARLLDAWQTVLVFTALPESIDATVTGPAEQPRQITGRLAAHARIEDGGAALIELADHAPTPGRSLSVLSEEAHLLIDDAMYRLVDADGRLREASDASVVPVSYTDLVAEQWRWLFDRPPLDISPDRQAQALACAHACLLSARTGQPESPAKLRALPW